ncbi:MAG: hypothetical protein AAF146_17940 [Bacteroidota bacterium]
MTLKTQWIQHLFGQLDGRDYVLLKHTGAEEEDADIDLLLSRPQTAEILPILLQGRGIDNYQVRRQATMWQLFLYFHDDTFLQVDFLFGFFRKSLRYLSTEVVQSGARVNAAGLRVCSPEHLIEHLLLFNWLNYAPIPEKYLDYFASLSPTVQASMKRQLQERYGLWVGAWSELGEYRPEWRWRIIDGLHARRANHWLRRTGRLLRHYCGVVVGFGQNRGMSISFSGVDGAGKSTIIEAVRATLQRKYRRKVVVLRHRPSLIPILSAYRYGKRAAEQRAATRLPRQGQNRSGWSSALRFGYYYADYLLGQFYIFFRYHLRSYIVLYDRYYFDFIVDGRRSNLQLDDRLPRFLYRFIHKPQLNFFLYARPEVIRARKQELPREDIQQLTDRYRQLFDQLGQERGGTGEYYLAIENEEKADTLQLIWQHYKKVQL